MKGAQLIAILALIALSCIAANRRSSHSEAPNTASIPNADITDLYAFRSYETGRSAYVTFLINAFPLQSPFGGPNYFSLSSEHFYELYLDTTNDGLEDYTFQWINGQSLPSSSPTGRPYLYQEDLQCGALYTFNTTPSQPSTPINLGIGLSINPSAPTQLTLIALKVAGTVLGTGGSRGNLNWEEYYFLNLLTGRLENPVVTNLTSSSGALRFDKPFDYAGQNSFGDAATYETYARSFIYTVNLAGTMACPAGSTGRVFVGQRQDPFYISLGRIFDYLNLIPVVLPQFAGLTISECLTNNDLREKNVDTLALEIPINCLNPSNGVLNIWAGTRMLYHNPGDLTGTNSHIAGPQTSRLGNPLVNELVIGLIDKNRFTRQHPKFDADSTIGFLNYVLYPTLPQIISNKYLAAANAILGASLTTLAPAVPRNDLVTAFLLGIPTITQATGGFAGEVLRLNVSTPAVAQGSQNRHGIVGTVLSGTLTDFAGFPNGRRPGDDVVDIAMMVVMGSLCAPAFYALGFNFCNNQTAPLAGVYLTDGSPIQASNYGATFPYFNTPTPGSYVDSPNNIVTNSSLCYPPAQHGRCAISAAPSPNPSTNPSGDGTDGDGGDGGAASGLSGFVLNLLKW